MDARTEADTSDREIVTRRVVDAPPELVWKVWTSAEHIAHWWGPNGFTTTTHEMDVRPGGLWRYTMHGPDGTDYPNRIVYRELEPPNRMAYDHGDDSGEIHFENTVRFDRVGTQTRITMRAVFPTKEARDFVVDNFGAVEGGVQHLANLSAHLDAMARYGGMPIYLVIRRRFSASAEQVFDAWVDPEKARHWFLRTPQGELVRAELDARVGGRWVVVEKRGDMEAYHGGEYLEIDRPRRLVFTFGVDPELTDAGRVQVDIAPLESGCQLTLMQEMHPKFAEYEERTKQGWATLLDGLARAIRGNGDE